MKKRKTNNYFTAETEKFIIEYNNSTDIEYRNKIFTSHIYRPFYKLAENIIHTFKFYYIDVENIEDLKHKVVSMLYRDKISKFDPSVGAKAYSYFGTIVKRWLINYSNINYKNLQKSETFDSSKHTLESCDEEEYYDECSESLTEFIDSWVMEVYSQLDVLFTKPMDKKIADAVLTLFKQRGNLNILKKKALYIYIREITECTTPQITKVVEKLKQNFYKKYTIAYERGLVSRN